MLHRLEQMKQFKPVHSGFFAPELLAVVAGVFLELRHQCALRNFRQKKGLRFHSKPLIYLAPPDGLEPPT